MIRHYLRLVLFAIGLLMGIQVPGVVDQYAKRVDASLQEAERNLSGFEDTAARHFGGDLAAMIRHYRESDDPVFRDDAENIDAIGRRVELLKSEWRTMRGPWFKASWHVLVNADDDLRHQTLRQYSYNVLMTPLAIGWGVVFALVLAWVVELPLALLGWLLFRPRQANTIRGRA